jgi:hypothetical protein
MVKAAGDPYDAGRCFNIAAREKGSTPMVRQTYRPTKTDKKSAPPTKPANVGVAQPEPKASVKTGLTRPPQPKGASTHG